MFPVFGSIGEGLRIALRFARAYWLFTLAMFVLAGVGAVAKGMFRLPLPMVMAQPSTVWVVDTVVLLLLVPAWTALYRFAILNDTGRGWWPPDMRMRRVALSLLALAVVALLGVLPLALALDVLPRMGPRRLVALAAIALAVLARLGSWWLAARLAIAPAMAATGTKPQALDVSFGYTRRNAFRILVTRLIIYLPLFAVIGLLELAGQHFAIGPRGVLLHGIASVAITTLLTTATEIVDGAVFARVAVVLVKAQRARASEQARRAREGKDDDD
jgi:hypothetical protein